VSIPTLESQTAVVTGASRGIGQAIARSLVEAGANVIVTARKQSSADQAAAEIGDRAFGFQAHSVDEFAAQACVDFAVEKFGKLDILVNNAGTNPGFGSLADLDRARFTKTFDLNVWAPIMWSGIAWKKSMGKHGGVIVNTSSVGAEDVAADFGVYNASKAALSHITRHQAIEFAPRVRVNAIAPGVVRTRLAEALWQEEEARVAATIPLGRIGEPEDIGPVVAFLATDAARWITGEVITVDGGQTLVSQAADAPSPSCVSQPEAASGGNAGSRFSR
jgi:NAD(P)-dependent dehydrogenase (short-subunit alcohol dehydrogenase family)